MAPYLGRMPQGLPEFPPPRPGAGLLWAAIALLVAVLCLGALATVQRPATEMDVLCDPWK